MQLSVPPGTTLQVKLSEPQEARYVTELATAEAREKAEQAALAKVYTLKELPDRLNLCRTTILEYLNLPESDGGLRNRKAGAKWLVTELACREWLGDYKKAA
jgi:hypothetical protein